MGYIDETWYVGSDGHKYYPHGLSSPNTHLIWHICSVWLITKKSNIQSSVWATLMKLGMWVVMGTSTNHMVCRHQMSIFNTSIAYLFSLANIRKVDIKSFVWATVMKLGMWVVVGTSITHQVCGH